MKQFNIWMEGYRATGESDVARIIGSFWADDFDDAVKQYAEMYPRSKVDFDRFGKGRHAIWACELFDNEADARKSFG